VAFAVDFAGGLDFVYGGAYPIALDTRPRSMYLRSRIRQRKHQWTLPLL